MKNIIFGFFLALSLLFPSGVLADAYSQGSTDYSISIDKKIRPIDDSNYYDNIGKDQKIFVNGDVVEYTIRVENTGKDILYNLNVKDYYPIVDQIILAPSDIDKVNRQINWKIDSLAAGESKTFTIRAKIFGITLNTAASQTNIASVSNNYVYDKDTATFYVNTKSSPKTGNNDLVIKSSIALSGALLALALRKLARGY